MWGADSHCLQERFSRSCRPPEVWRRRQRLETKRGRQARKSKEMTRTTSRHLLEPGRGGQGSYCSDRSGRTLSPCRGVTCPGKQSRSLGSRGTEQRCNLTATATKLQGSLCSLQPRGNQPGRMGCMRDAGPALGRVHTSAHTGPGWPCSAAEAEYTGCNSGCARLSAQPCVLPA